MPTTHTGWILIPDFGWFLRRCFHPTVALKIVLYRIFGKDRSNEPWDGLLETKIFLEHVKAYGDARYYIWCYHPDDLKYLNSPTGKLKMLNDRGYLTFTSSPHESGRKENQGMLKIDSITLTPEGEELLKRHTDQELPVRILKVINERSIVIIAAIITSILTVIVLNWLGLVVLKK